MVRKYGSEEAYKQHMRDIRKLVDDSKHPGGSFKNRKFAKQMSKLAVKKRVENAKAGDSST